MSDITISQLINAPSLSGTEYVPIDQTNKLGVLTTYYISLSTLSEYIKDHVIPVGVVWPYAGIVGGSLKQKIPTGWLLCDGSAVLISKYSALYQKIGFTYGTASQPSLFRLPDIRGRMLLGYCNTTNTYSPNFGNASGLQLAVGSVGGEFTHNLTTSELPSHNHGASITVSGDLKPAVSFLYSPGSGIEQDQEGGPNGPESAKNYITPILDVTASLAAVGDSLNHNTIPPYQVLNYIIKY